jgi:hypothetical protein
VSRNRCEQDAAVQPESQVGRNHMANEASSPHLAIHHKVKPGAGTSAGSQKGRCPSSGDQQDRLRLPADGDIHLHRQGVLARIGVPTATVLSAHGQAV